VAQQNWDMMKAYYQKVRLEMTLSKIKPAFHLLEYTHLKWPVYNVGCIGILQGKSKPCFLPCRKGNISFFMFSNLCVSYAKVNSFQARHSSSVSSL
jgi:hypothetical protein